MASKDKKINTKDMFNSSFEATRSDFLMQGSILAVAGIIVRIIGIFYRIPMINIIGEEGNGYYTSAYSIYSLFLIISSYSFPIALSKIISSRFSTKNYADGYKAFKLSLLIATVIGAIMFIIMYFGSSVIASMVKKPYLKFSLQVFAPTLWVMAYLSVFRGLFQGTGTMVPTAVSQVCEQIVNAIVSLVCCYVFFSQGLLANVIYDNTEYAYAFGAKGATMGTFAGALTALIILAGLFMLIRPKLVRRAMRSDSRENIKGLSLIILFTIAPIILSSTIYNCFAVIADLIYSNLVFLFGNKETMIANWGVFGQFHLLFNIPVACASALSSSVIPAITNAVAKRDGIEATKKIKYSIRYTLLILLPATIGLSVLAFPICRVLFGSAETSLLVKLTKIGSISVLFFGLSTITSGILQGIDQMKKPVIHGAIGLGVAVIVLTFFLTIIKLDIYAVVIANIVFAFIISGLNIYSIISTVHYRVNLLEGVLFPLCASLIMGVVVALLNKTIIKILPQSIATSLFPMLINLLICVIVGVIVYLILIIILGCVRKKDVEYYPLFNKIERFIRR